MRRRRAAAGMITLVAVLVAVLVAGCADTADSSSRTTPSPSATATSARPLLDFAVTGGFIGRDDRLRMDTDGRYTVTHTRATARTGRLPAADLTALRTDLAHADLAALPTRMVDEGARDLFLYHLTHAGHTVVTDRTDRTPGLDRVLDRLEPLLS